ncbi:uncharacterized protein TRAVEDRAFT_32131 [Trametes versicolor FP-101664 SS1]|uniref:uncharacterized protein n=1 Tax=Trametes versicolor (strain FP-101664) TaxID=717944 RepID=UPI0004623752|nr:uncharacterized protein TRAVEDRAFT_32131 [Trametes versicolor FP-101664 SS1]EIW52419.1 hypothetical protein TRAVEDRAFT_32131 [Trametes versicolor FP-101664 SS1]
MAEKYNSRPGEWRSCRRHDRCGHEESTGETGPRLGVPECSEMSGGRDATSAITRRIW